jgi:hypothetical protein
MEMTHQTTGIQVEWFRARERSRRWNEEVHWLRREAATVVLDFSQRSLIWKGRLRLPVSPGRVAYAHRQMAMWYKLSRDAHSRLRHILQVRVHMRLLFIPWNQRLSTPQASAEESPIGRRALMLYATLS